MTKTALEIAREKRQAMKAAGEKIDRLDPIEKARRKPKSLRLAVNAKCWDCVGGDTAPGARGFIRDCKCGSYCSLFPVRPYQKGVANTDQTSDDFEDFGDPGEYDFEDFENLEEV